MLSDKWISNTLVTADFLQAPSWRKSLKATDLAKKQANVGLLKSFSGEEIKKVEYQTRAIEAACKEVAGLFSLELWTGAGKSVVAAFIALYFLARGKKVIFICPSRMGLGDESVESGGIIHKFYRVFTQYAPGSEHVSGKYKLGRLNEVTRLNDVNFITPAVFVRLKKDKAFFERLVGEAGLLIVDEAHHFPRDPKGDRVIYGKIETISRNYFTDCGKKVVTLTATHGRMDGKLVVAKQKPDFQITVYEAVQMGYCPEVHGLRVQLQAKAPRASRSGGDFDLRLRGRKLAKYVQEIVGWMIRVQKLNPSAQFCAFVRSIAEAGYLAEVWNHEAEKRGFKKIAVITKDVPHIERERIKSDLKKKHYQGYVTCSAGAESIDIPALEIVHLIVRTQSVNKLVQSIGRALRLHEGKGRTLIVDYQVAEVRIIKACLGLADYAKQAGVPCNIKTLGAGPLVVANGSKNAKFTGTLLASEDGWVIRELEGPSNHEENFPVLLDMARKQFPKPSKKSKGYYKFNRRRIKISSVAATLSYLVARDRQERALNGESKGHLHEHS